MILLLMMFTGQKLFFCLCCMCGSVKWVCENAQGMYCGKDACDGVCCGMYIYNMMWKIKFIELKQAISLDVFVF